MKLDVVAASQAQPGEPQSQPPELDLPESAGDSAESSCCCRLCLQSWPGPEPSHWIPLDPELVQKILAFAAIQIQQNDGLPTTICTNCRDLVYMSYDFKYQVEKNDHDLRQVLLTKQSTLNTKWPTVSIEKCEETANVVEAIIPCLQNNIINSSMTIENNYTTNNHPQITLKIAADDISSDTFENNNFPPPTNLAENQFAIGGNILTFQVNNNNTLETQNSEQTFQNQCQTEKSTSNFNSDSKSIEEYSDDNDDIPLILRTKRHKCNYCIKSFANLSDLEKHTDFHKVIKEKLYVCYVCDQEFPSIKKAKNHAKDSHGLNVTRDKMIKISRKGKNNSEQCNLLVETKNEKSTYTCIICSRIFSCPKLVLSHMKCHVSYKHKLLNNRLILIGETANHPTNSDTVSHSTQTESSYSVNSETACHLPDLKTASYPENAEITTQSQNNPGKRMNNSHKGLGEPAESDGNLNGNKHNRDNSDDDYHEYEDDRDDEDEDSPGDDDSLEANMQCNDCGKLVTTRRLLKKHLLTHANPKYKCSVCNKDFLRLDKLKEHQLMKHKQDEGGKSDSDDNANDNKDKSHRRYKCKLCPKTFAQAQTLTNHEEKHKLVREERKRYLCEICSKCFAQSGSLVAHMRIHTGVKPYVCNVCSRAFTKSTYLQLHLRTHSGEKPYICQYCERAFARANTLARHVTMHTGEAKYKCQICLKYFRRLTSLNEHMYTHTGQRPYGCKICGKRYNNAGSLYAHTKKCKSAAEATASVVNDDTNNQITFEPSDYTFNNNLLPSNDNNIASQILIFTDKNLIPDEALLADTTTCQLMIANMPSQRPISINMLEQFTIPDTDNYNVNSRQFRTPYSGFYPTMPSEIILDS